mmetsp:Transcript_76007/g.180853  ORF Transcript_76007/g.180853 Transcript_76007/m.180853 type:complete len:590 (+) Transcript_76007:99-1868(+)
MACARSPCIDVTFSDDRFLQNVLKSAQQSHAPSHSIKRIQDLGFSAEAAQVALHVSHGDEERALQLCLSGLCYLGAGRAIYDKPPGSEEHPAGPKAVKCYICGQRHLTERSLQIHMKACRRTFLQREAERPPNQRRPLIEAEEMPEEFDCLLKFYEAAEGAGGAPPAVETPRKTQLEANASTPPFEAWLSPPEGGMELSPCRYCHRTFAPARLQKHEKVCMERPKQEPCPSTPKRFSGAGTPSSPSGPPAAAAKAYASFCGSLVPCQSCGRQFRRELLPAHAANCESLQQKLGQQSHQSASLAAQLKLPVARVSTLGGRSMMMKPTKSNGSNGSASSTATPSAASATRRQQPLTPTGSTGRSSKKQSGVAAATSPSSRLAADTSQNQTEDALLSTGVLTAKGLLVAASDDDVTRMRAEVARALPGAEFVGAFRVPEGTQGVIYSAMQQSMREELEGSPTEDASLERALWHGTTWTTIPKILRHGFNRSFAGRHGTLLGHGTYFSSDLGYSKRFCDRSGGGMDGTKVVLLARVLTGSYCKGSSADVEPPLREEATGTRFNSTVDNEENPKTFVVFRDFQAVPEFLVEFRL